jgi:hypothetical protein
VLVTRPALIVMLLSGMALGALNGYSARILRRMKPDDDTSPLAKVRRVAWFMCGILTAITVLMAVKPG